MAKGEGLKAFTLFEGVLMLAFSASFHAED